MSYICNLKFSYTYILKTIKVKLILIMFITLFLSIFKDFSYLFLERGKRSEKQRERNIHVWEKHPSAASPTPSTGDLAHNPGMCSHPDQELNWRSFSLAHGTRPNPLSHTGPGTLFIYHYYIIWHILYILLHPKYYHFPVSWKGKPYWGVLHSFVVVVLSIQNSVRILHLQHISAWPSHVSSSQKSHMQGDSPKTRIIFWRVGSF